MFKTKWNKNSFFNFCPMLFMLKINCKQHIFFCSWWSDFISDFPVPWIIKCHRKKHKKVKMFFRLVLLLSILSEFESKVDRPRQLGEQLRALSQRRRSRIYDDKHQNESKKFINMKCIGYLILCMIILNSYTEISNSFFYILNRFLWSFKPELLTWDCTKLKYISTLMYISGTL